MCTAEIGWDRFRQWRKGGWWCTACGDPVRCAWTAGWVHVPARQPLAMPAPDYAVTAGLEPALG